VHASVKRWCEAGVKRSAQPPRAINQDMKVDTEAAASAQREVSIKGLAQGTGELHEGQKGRA